MFFGLHSSQEKLGITPHFVSMTFFGRKLYVWVINSQFTIRIRIYSPGPMQARTQTFEMGGGGEAIFY